MIKITGAMDRIIAIAAGITAHTRFDRSTDGLVVVGGRYVTSVRAAAKRGLVTITDEWNDGLRNLIKFELTDLGLERACELEELHVDPQTGIIPVKTLINL